MLGLFSTPPILHLMCSFFPVEFVPKKDTNDMELIMCPSYPYWLFINDFIDKEKAFILHQQFNDAFKLVVQQSQFT